MRTRIYLSQRDDGTWNDDDGAPYIDVNHPEPLTDDEIAAFRELGGAVVERAEQQEGE